MAAPQGFDAATTPLTEEDTVMPDSGSGHRPSCSNENQNSNAVEEQSTSDLPMKDIDDAADENVEESEDPPTTQGKPVDHQSPAWWDNDQNPKRLLVVTAYAALFLASAATCERAFQLKNFAKRLYPICRDGWDWRWGVISRKDRRRARKFLKRNKTGVPGILFRGFHSQSGGGVDPRLNGPHGVIPHAYLHDRKPKDIWTFGTPREIVNAFSNHLTTETNMETHFSSWTHTLKEAFRFVRKKKYGENDSSTVAVLDTSSMVDHVWYTPDLNAAGLSRGKKDMEFLVYGPISGPKYHCVPFKELKTANTFRILQGSRAIFGKDPERISLVERRAVESSRKIATLLQPQGGRLANIVVLTAKFVGVRVKNLRGKLKYLGYLDMHGFLYYARDDLQGLAMRADAGDVSLANQTMDTSFSKALEFEVQMQQAAESAVRIMARDLRAAMYSLLDD